jgi:hypothetical protein
MATLNVHDRRDEEATGRVDDEGSPGERRGTTTRTTDVPGSAALNCVRGGVRARSAGPTVVTELRRRWCSLLRRRTARAKVAREGRTNEVGSDRPSCVRAHPRTLARIRRSSEDPPGSDHPTIPNVVGSTALRTHYALGGSSEPIRGMCFTNEDGTRRGNGRARGAHAASFASGVRYRVITVGECRRLSGNAEAAFSAGPRVLRIAALTARTRGFFSPILSTDAGEPRRGLRC